MNIIRLPNSRRKLVVATVVLSLLIVAATGYGLWSYLQGQEPVAPETDPALVEDSTTALMDDDDERLRDSAKRIKEIDGYEQVPEYVYIVARAEALDGNAQEVARLLEIFKGFDDDTTYSGNLEHLSHQNLQTQLETDLRSAQAIEQSNQNNSSSPGGGAAGMPEGAGA